MVDKALRSVIVIGFLIKIQIESIILRLLKSNFNAIFLRGLSGRDGKHLTQFVAKEYARDLD